MAVRVLKPRGWKRPKGYANGVAASGRHVFTAGIVGWNEEEVFESKDFAGQFRQILLNTRAILAEGGAAPADIVRMTWYVTDKREYLASLKEIGAAWKEIFGAVYPCMAVVEVASLMEDEAKVEIETTAIVSETDPPPREGREQGVGRNAARSVKSRKNARRFVAPKQQILRGRRSSTPPGGEAAGAAP